MSFHTFELGDCLEVLSKYDDNYFNLIVTSPPYADRRGHTYGGIHPDNYVDWFLRRSDQFFRVLKEDGTFILNIKEGTHKKERLTYVIELVLALRKQGWLWTEEFIWHKKNCFPGKWPNRFRNCWEHIYQFNKSYNFKMFQDSVVVQPKPSSVKRLRKLNYDNDFKRHYSATDSKLSANKSNMVERTVDRGLSYPSNVLYMAVESRNRRCHSAAFPKSLPEWFIKLFTEEGDVVLDPFVGSGTVMEVCRCLNRNSVGIDMVDLPQETVEYLTKDMVEREL